ncbi:MAG: hypothetical protein ACYCYF_02825 [Anaerolineae bacterium]
MSDGIQYSRFAVDKTPMCVWEWDLQERNLAFIESIDPTYFAYLADVHEQRLADADHSQHAALSIRMAYAHGLETFFAFLLAAVQAPDCVIGWVHAYSDSDLRDLVRKVQRRESVLTKLNIDRVTWETVSSEIHRFMVAQDEDGGRQVSGLYARAWSRLAADFVREPNAHEYNSIKHGLRAHPGGFRLAIGREGTEQGDSGTATMQLLADSEFGSSFYIREKIGAEARHFRVRRHFVNWTPVDLASGLHLIHLSLHNVLAFLRLANGAPVGDVQYLTPTNDDDFEKPWTSLRGVRSFMVDTAVVPSHIMNLSSEEILDVYNSHGEGPRVAARPRP